MTSIITLIIKCNVCCMNYCNHVFKGLQKGRLDQTLFYNVIFKAVPDRMDPIIQSGCTLPIINPWCPFKFLTPSGSIYPIRVHFSIIIHDALSNPSGLQPLACIRASLRTHAPVVSLRACLLAKRPRIPHPKILQTMFASWAPHALQIFTSMDFVNPTPSPHVCDFHTPWNSWWFAGGSKRAL